MLYLHKNTRGTLYLYIFRGEPAIPRFGRHITPNLKSSHWLVTQTSSGLPHDFHRGSPCSRLAHRASGLPISVKFWSFKPCFHYAFATKWLRLKRISSNSPVHSSIGTLSPFDCSQGSSCLLANGFSNSFTPLPGYFSPFPHGTSSLSVRKNI